MAKLLPLFRASAGLNNKVDPTRIQYDPETGVVDLSAAYNIILDPTGRLSRRKGFELKKADAWGYHSLFSCGSYALGVTYDALEVIEKDWSTTKIRTVTDGARMDYVRVGDKIYYGNGFEVGYVRDRLSYGWVDKPYIGPDTTKTYSSPPTGTILEVYGGRMFIAKENILFFSEPLAFDRFDLARGYILYESRIQLVKAVSNGLYVGNESKIFFEGGGSPREFQHILAADYPAVSGAVAVAYLPGVEFGLETTDEYAIIGTKQGLCIAGPSGQLINLTEDKITYPNVNRGLVLVRDNNILLLFED